MGGDKLNKKLGQYSLLAGAIKSMFDETQNQRIYNLIFELTDGEKLYEIEIACLSDNFEILAGHIQQAIKECKAIDSKGNNNATTH